MWTSFEGLSMSSSKSGVGGCLEVMVSSGRGGGGRRGRARSAMSINQVGSRGYTAEDEDQGEERK